MTIPIGMLCMCDAFYASVTISIITSSSRYHVILILIIMQLVTDIARMGMGMDLELGHRV